MNPKLILVDYENIQKIDLSVLDDSFRAIIFVGANQNPPKAARKPESAHRFKRVDFHKVQGAGKNALDFHIAFYLGRVIETAPTTKCFILSKDKGFDPLLVHLNESGLSCRRIETLVEISERNTESTEQPAENICKRCNRASTIEHHGGLWCTNCGCFATPPDPKLLPSMQKGYSEPIHKKDHRGSFVATCGWCHTKADMSDGIYDDGEWMCGSCISRYAR